MNLGSCPKKKAISLLEEITFNWKQTNILLVRADFLWFKE